MALNGKELVLTEIKTRLRLSDIEKFVNKQIPNFKEYFGKRYEGRRIIGALASLAIDAELEKQGGRIWFVCIHPNKRRRGFLGQ